MGYEIIEYTIMILPIIIPLVGGLFYRLLSGYYASKLEKLWRKEVGLLSVHGTLNMTDED